MPISWGGGSWGSGVWGGGISAPEPDTLGASPAVVGRGIFKTLALDTDGDLLVPVSIAAGPIAYIHRINSRLRFYAGEYFLDTRLGVPYYQTIYVKGTSLAVMNAILRKAIITCPGVVSCDEFESSIDTRKRIATANWKATIDDGTILTARDEPFIVRGDSFGRSYGQQG